MTTEPTGWTFSQVPIWITCDPRISAQAYRLLVYLAWRQGNDDYCWPSVSRIATDLGKSREAIRRRLRELERAGYLVTRLRIGSSSTYAIVPNPDGAADRYMPRPRTPAWGPPTRPREGALGSEGGGPSRAWGSPHGSEGGPPSSARGTPLTREGHDDRHGRENGDGEKEKREKEDQLAAVWPSICSYLRAQMTQATFDLWFANAAVRWEDGCLVVRLGSRRAVDAVSHQLHATIKHAARRVLDRDDLAIAYEVRGL